MARFADISDDILYLIFSFLGSERLPILHGFRSVSRRLKIFAESVLYREIVLEEDNDAQEQATYRFIERILDSTDALCGHVRSVRVRSFKGDDASSCMNTQLLQACLRSINRLDSFSWDANLPLPDEILSVLHEICPGIQPRVTLKHIDQRVLQLIHLHGLSVSVPGADVDQPDSINAFDQLKHALVRCRNLRSLTLDVHQDPKLRQEVDEKHVKLVQDLTTQSGKKEACSTIQASAGGDFKLLHDSRNVESTNRIQLPLLRGDYLPPLDELFLNASTYVLDHSHCFQLLQCMDWTRLKKLSLGPSNPTSFFKTFTDKLPLLEHLEFAYHSPRRAFFPYNQQVSLSECAQFVTTLNKLKVLVVRCDIFDLTSGFWYSLLSTHSERLRSLSIQPRRKGLDAPICRTGLFTTLPHFTVLKTLELALSTSYISIRLGACDSRSLHAYIADHAEGATRAIWSLYSTVEHGFKLETLRLCFWRWEAPSSHCDENGTTDCAYINEVVFDSWRVRGDLVVRARDSRRTITTRYKETWQWDEEAMEPSEKRLFPRAHYIKAQHDHLGQPFQLDERFGARGREWSSRRTDGLINATDCAMLSHRLANHNHVPSSLRPAVNCQPSFFDVIVLSYLAHFRCREPLPLNSWVMLANSWNLYHRAFTFQGQEILRTIVEKPALLYTADTKNTSEIVSDESNMAFHRSRRPTSSDSGYSSTTSTPSYERIKDFGAFDSLNSTEVKRSRGQAGTTANPLQLSKAVRTDVNASIGTQFSNVQLSNLNEQDMEELALLVSERGVVFFRNQNLTLEEQAQLFDRRGKHGKHITEREPGRVKTKTSATDFGEVATVPRGKRSEWSSDRSFEAKPASYTILKANEAGGGNSLALTILDDSIRDLRGMPKERTPVETHHPAVRTHAITGLKTLNVTPGAVTDFEDLSRKETDKLLELLEYNINSSDEHTVRFRWEAGSVAIWDNRCTAYKHISSTGFIKGFESSIVGGKRRYTTQTLGTLIDLLAAYFQTDSESREEQARRLASEAEEERVRKEETKRRFNNTPLRRILKRQTSGAPVDLNFTSPSESTSEVPESPPRQPAFPLRSNSSIREEEEKIWAHSSSVPEKPIERQPLFKLRTNDEIRELEKEIWAKSTVSAATKTDQEGKRPTAVRVSSSGSPLRRIFKDKLRAGLGLGDGLGRIDV
ncbi:hypothetical protein EK21DRAFT_90930 [Setomelanomma holmii]|uniref:TauD/TfdA-like domain-containing protein n=1 Tax=Setomelanomma holmii TaxID=210430 RepID=A0A9P4H5U5_9PLEO|nr:hypothetical protein EK21DRAFT_90930 [Setomelanomma holmii]